MFGFLGIKSEINQSEMGSVKRVGCLLRPTQGIRLCGLKNQEILRIIRIALQGQPGNELNKVNSRITDSKPKQIEIECLTLSRIIFVVQFQKIRTSLFLQKRSFSIFPIFCSLNHIFHVQTNFREAHFSQISFNALFFDVLSSNGGQTSSNEAFSSRKFCQKFRLDDKIALSRP